MKYFYKCKNCNETWNENNSICKVSKKDIIWEIASCDSCKAEAEQFQQDALVAYGRLV